MVVYMDVVFIENLIINFFILLIAFKVNGLKYKYRLIFFSSSLGAIYSILAFMPNLEILKSFTIKIIFAMVMVFISLIYKNIKDFFRCFISFFLIAFMFGGICFTFAIWQNDYKILKNFVIENYNIKYSVLALMVVYIVVDRIFYYLKDKAKISNFIYDLEFNIYENPINIRGFLDTGCDLIEPVTRLPIIIIYKDLLKEYDLKNEEVFYIPFNVVGGYGGKLKGIRVNNIKIKYIDGRVLKKDAIVCICKNKLSKDYEALLSRNVI